MAAVGLAEKVKYDEHLKDASQEPQPLHKYLPTIFRENGLLLMANFLRQVLRSTCRDRQVLWAWAQRLRMALSLSTSSGVILRPYWVLILLMSTLGAITLYVLE